MRRCWIVSICLAVVLCSAAYGDDALPELSPATIGKKYVLQISLAVAGAAPFTYALGGEEKPAGLSIDPATGVLQGIPSRAALGTHRVHVVVTDYNGKQTTQDFLLHVTAIATAGLPTRAVAKELAAKASEKTSKVADAAADAKVPADAKAAADPKTASDAKKPTASDSAGSALAVGASAGAQATGEAGKITVLTPIIVNTPTAGDTSITVNGMPTTATSGKTTFTVIPLEKITDTCAPGPPPLDLKSPGVATENTATVLKLEDPLSANSIACVYQTFVGVAGVTPATDNQTTKPFVVAPLIALMPPRIKTPLNSGQLQVTVVAQPAPPPADAAGAADPATAAVPHVQLLLQNGLAATPCDANHGFPVALSKGANAASTDPTPYDVPTDRNGIAILNLANPLEANEYVCALETYQNSDGTHVRIDPGASTSSSSLVVDPASLGRVTTYFTGGILLANDDSNASNTGGSSFSTAHEFLDLYVDKSWLLPGCYLHRYANQEDEGTCQAPAGSNDKHYSPGWFMKHYPGIDTFFEARLTAIPVAQSTSLTGLSASTAGAAAKPALRPAADAPADTSSTDAAAQTFNTSQKTARLVVGAYLPFLLTRWDWDYSPNSLFLGPLAKIGFDTLTGPTSQMITDANGNPATLSYERLYNFYGFGARLGHMGLTNSNRQAPELLSYLDILAGPYSNLESFICHPGSAAGQPFTGSNCPVYQFAQGSVDSRKRLYRLDFEGMLKIPHLPVVLGFNANIGQRSLGAAKLDQTFQPPDDLRFLFGTRFDVSAALSKLGLVSSTSDNKATAK